MLIQADRAISRALLLRRAGKAATGLAACGVGLGDTVAILMRNDLPFLEVSLAARTVGAYAVPINWHATGPEVGYLLRDCQAKVLVGHADLLAQVKDSIPPEVIVLAVETPADIVGAYRLDASKAVFANATPDWSEWLGGQSDWAGGTTLAAESMLYTSGTTGRPKGVRRFAPSCEQLSLIDDTRRNIYGIKPGIRTVVAAPMYHGAPNGIAIRAAQVADLVVVMARFDPIELLALIEKHRIDTLFMVPTMFIRLINLDDAVRNRYDLSSLRFVLHAAAPCAIDVKRRMIAWWGPVIYEFYGGTESGPITFCSSQEWISHPGTVGRVIDNAILKIFNDHGEEAVGQEPGELFVRLGHYPDFTYQGQPEKRREVERDGLITLGDVGYLDPNGFLFLCDRKRDMVIIGGANVYPAEIELVLLDMPGVKDCAVFGIPDKEYGEALIALIEPHPGVSMTQEDVRSFCQKKLSGLKIPRRIEFRAGLPREDSGKILKRLLRAPYWEGAGRQI